MKLTRPEWISICLHVSGHNLCCSFLLPDGKEKKADAEKKNLVKVSQDWCAGWGRSSLTPTWLSEVLLSLPMVIQGVQRPSGFSQRQLEETGGHSHLWDWRRSEPSSGCSSPQTQKPDDGKCLSLQSHHGKLFLKGFLLQCATQTSFPVTGWCFYSPPRGWQTLLKKRVCNRVSELTPMYTFTYTYIHKRSDKGAHLPESLRSGAAPGVLSVSNHV